MTCSNVQHRRALIINRSHQGSLCIRLLGNMTGYVYCSQFVVHNVTKTSFYRQWTRFILREKRKWFKVINPISLYTDLSSSFVYVYSRSKLPTNSKPKRSFKEMSIERSQQQKTSERPAVARGRRFYLDERYPTSLGLRVKLRMKVTSNRVRLVSNIFLLQATQSLKRKGSVLKKIYRYQLCFRVRQVRFEK